MANNKHDNIVDKFQAFLRENNVTDISDIILLAEMTKIARKKTFPLSITDFLCLFEGGDFGSDV